MTTAPLVKSRYICQAKINVGLEVLRKREDGYHELNTLFVRVDDPHDVIEVRPAQDFRLTCSDPDLSTNRSNLIVKAIMNFTKVFERSLPPLHLHLNKSMPMGAGLGGGSSNAATALEICNDYFGQPTDEMGMMAIGSDIGADVPFFASGYRASIGTGIGDILREVKLPLRCWILIVKPGSISISTNEAYSNLSIGNGHATDLQAAVTSGAWQNIRNDFETAIFPLAPELLRIKSALLEVGAFYASMSGSGSAIYGLFNDDNTLTTAVEKMKKMGYPSWQSTIGQKR